MPSHLFFICPDSLSRVVEFYVMNGVPENGAVLLFIALSCLKKGYVSRPRLIKVARLLGISQSRLDSMLTTFKMHRFIDGRFGFYVLSRCLRVDEHEVNKSIEMLRLVLGQKLDDILKLVDT